MSTLSEKNSGQHEIHLAFKHICERLILPQECHFPTLIIIFLLFH